jgi:PAS domain S-box-containing protein
LSSAPGSSQSRIDKTALFIAAIGPILWIIDSFFSSIFLNESFVKQVFYPGSSALLLRLWLVFFIFLQAWFLNSHSRAKNRVFEIEGKLKSFFDLAQDALVVTDIEGRVVEASGKAQELWGYSQQELSDLDLTRLCAASESERLINFIREIIKNKASGMDNVTLAVKNSLIVSADIKGSLIDNLGGQDQPGIFLDISRRKILEQSAEVKVVERETTAAKPEFKSERGSLEEAVRKEEAKKSQEALKNLEQKYLELMRTRLAEECKKVEDAVRLEERKKAEEQIRALESKGSQAIDANKSNLQRSQIEEAIRQEEAKKYQDKLDALENKYSEMLKVRVAEARQQAEELIALEEKRKSEERMRDIEAKFAEESGIKISEGRKLIEDAVRQEEQRKGEENALAQRQKYEELLRKGIEDERKRCEESAKLEREKIEAAIRQEDQKKAEEQIRALETRLTGDWEEKLQQERKRVEEVVRREEKKYAEEAVKAGQQKYEQEMQARLADERKRIEEALRLEEKKYAEETVKAGQQKYEQEMQARLADERKRIEEALRLEADKRIEEEKKTIGDAVRQLEQKKALEAAKAIEKSHAEALAEVAKKVDEQALIKAKELRSLEMGKMVKGLSLQVMIPLTAVLNNIKMMNIKFAQGEDLKVSEVKDSVNAIEENASLAKSILTSLSDVSSGSGSSFKPVSLNDPIERIDALYGKELKMQSITLQKMLLPNLPLVNGDPTLLFLVLFNMVSNAKWAIKKDAYRVGGGTIIIRTQKSAKEGFVELIISDDGVGISKQDLKHVFEPFFTTKKEGEGLGLGLAIVSEIIKAHRGEVHAETQIGSGAIFKITLPALASKE